MYIEQINSPKDLKQLTAEQMTVLAGEIRQALLNRLSTCGGHIGPNLGMVEATIALHFVFDSPKDKLVFDVSHQCYTHKILTGRKEAFLDPAKYASVSGYTNPYESEHDFFTIGHTSTSVSLACGLAKARDLKRDSENVIAVIGDGSLSGGEAYEGLSNAAEMGTNLIIVVNDNDMSIAENHGGLYGNLRQLRESKGEAPCNFFKSLGLDYLYVDEGNDISALIAAFRQVKDASHPVVVHIHTQKGKGYAFAEQNREKYHWGGPFNLQTGEPKNRSTAEDYGDLTGRFLLEEMAKDPTLVAISSGTPTVLGFTPERRQQAGRQFVDVGIAEGHAVTFSAGLAAEGMVPFCNIYSSFMQRAYDNVIHDVALQGLHVVMCLDRAGLVGEDGATHHGVFDLAGLLPVPGLTIASPLNEVELRNLMFTALKTPGPFVIRYPRGKGVTPDWRRPMELLPIGKGQILREGDEIALLTLGPVGNDAAWAAEQMAAEGVSVLHADLRFAKPLDEELLHRIGRAFTQVVTVEDGVIEGGVGEAVLAFFNAHGYPCRVTSLGIQDRFIPHGTVDQLKAMCGYDRQGILQTLRQVHNATHGPSAQN